MEIRLDSCVLRPWRAGDEPSLVRHADDYDVWRNLRDRFPHPYTHQDAREWLELNEGQEPLLNFAVEVDGAAVGGIGLVPGRDIYRLAAEIGYWLGREFWGRGIMTGAVRAVSTYAFDTLDLVRLFACVFDGNEASIRVLQNAGYHFEARLKRSVVKEDQLCDQLIWVRLAERTADVDLKTQA